MAFFPYLPSQIQEYILAFCEPAEIRACLFGTLPDHRRIQLSPGFSALFLRSHHETSGSWEFFYVRVSRGHWQGITHGPFILSQHGKLIFQGHFVRGKIEGWASYYYRPSTLPPCWKHIQSLLDRFLSGQPTHFYLRFSKHRLEEIYEPGHLQVTIQNGSEELLTVHDYQKRQSYCYLQGLLHYWFVQYHENGRLREAQHFEEGFRQGTYLRWNTEGQLLVQGEFCRNRKWGTWKIRQNSELLVENYQDDLLHGECFRFSAEGSFESTHYWRGFKQGAQIISRQNFSYTYFHRGEALGEFTLKN